MPPVAPRSRNGKFPTLGRCETRLRKIAPRSAFKRVSDIADFIGVSRTDVQHFLANRRSKVSKASWKKIRAFFIQRGWIKTRPKPEQHKCPSCGGMHRKEKTVELLLRGMLKADLL